MNERVNERMARYLVSTVLGAPVERHEDGSAPSQVDAVIRYPDRLGALEIVADHESDFNRQWDALEKINHRISAPGLGARWSAQLRRRASIRRLSRNLPSLLLKSKEDTQFADGWRGSAMPPSLSAFGIISLEPTDGDPIDEVILFAEGWSGVSDETGGVMAGWVENVLQSQFDVPSKLQKHPATEKHAFIWTTIGTSYSVQFQLEDRGQGVPTEFPTLPHGVTHVWVAGSFNSQGCLAWFPDRGWWRTPWQWPAQPIELRD